MVSVVGMYTDVVMLSTPGVLGMLRSTNARGFFSIPGALGMLRSINDRGSFVL